MLSKTQREQANVVFTRAVEIAEALDEPGFRGSYMAQHLRTFLADQIRALRGNMSQAAFGRLIGKPQSVVSRLENEDYGGLSLQTLIDIAIKLDIAIIVRFVDYPTFIRVTSDFSDDAAAPKAYEASHCELMAMATGPVPFLWHSAKAVTVNGSPKPATDYRWVANDGGISGAA